MKVINAIISVAILALVLCACTGEEALPIQTVTPFPTSTATLAATPTLTSTPSPVPTDTLVPTVTPVPTAELPFETLMTLLNISDSFYKSGEYEMALVIYDEMLSYDRDPMFFVLRADTYDKLGDFDAAISDYMTAIDLGLKDGTILNNLCWDLGITGQAEKALPYCEQAVKAEASSTHRDSRGLTYAQLGMIKEAVADFQVVMDDLKNTTDPELKAIAAERQKWLTSLLAGANPITSEVLAKLRKDTSAVTVTTTPVPDSILVQRSFIQKSAREDGFAFDKVDVSGSEEILTGNMIQGSCKVILKLVGPETDLNGASIQITGCSDEEQSGYAMWFMSTLLPGKREVAKAMVYMVTDIYYVIEGKVEATAEKEIGNVIFETKRSEDPGPTLLITARFKK